MGVVAAKDLPAEPSEEEFRLGLRSGLILCNVLNKVQPGAVPKVVVFALLLAIFFQFFIQWVNQCIHVVVLEGCDLNLMA